MQCFSEDELRAHDAKVQAANLELIADLEAKLKRERDETHRLRVQLIAQDKGENIWKIAVIDALVVNWGYSKVHEELPEKALRDLINVEVATALDPQVSTLAQALIDKGRALAEAEAESDGGNHRHDRFL